MNFEALQSSVNEAENDAPESIPLLENAETKAMESEAMESEGNKLDRPIVQDIRSGFRWLPAARVFHIFLLLVPELLLTDHLDTQM